MQSHSPLTNDRQLQASNHSLRKLDGLPRRERIRLSGLVVAFGSLLGGCSGVPPVGAEGNTLSAGSVDPSSINWPEGYRPDDAVFFVHNEIEIDAPPEVVWSELVDAALWTEWYRGASGVRVEGGDHGRLGRDAEFRWRTMDQNFVSRVEEFEPPYRLSWESRKGLIQGYHAWLIIRTERGSRVVTEESQFGFLAHMQRLFRPNKLRNLHDEWLDGLRARAEGISRDGQGNAEGGAD